MQNFKVLLTSYMKFINSRALLRTDSRLQFVEINDCIVYALATAFDLDYETAYEEVSLRMKRQLRKGVPASLVRASLVEGTNINGRTITQVIKSPTRMYRIYGNSFPRQIRLSTFVKENQHGSFLILLRDHAITLKEGVIYDNKKKVKTASLVRTIFRVD